MRTHNFFAMPLIIIFCLLVIPLAHLLRWRSLRPINVIIIIIIIIIIICIMYYSFMQAHVTGFVIFIISVTSSNAVQCMYIKL